MRLRHLILPALVAATLSALTAGPAIADSTEPGMGLAPLPADQWTREAAAHLLRRAGFGGTPAEIDALHARGLEGAIDFLVDYESQPTDDLQPFVPQQYISLRRHQLAEVRKLGRRPNEDERRKIRITWRRNDYQQIYMLKMWWLSRMATTPRPLEERLTLLWHNHFCSGHRDVRNSYHMLMQNALLRRHAAGDFRAFVKAISRDPAMLEYLDNRVNRKQHPNENFARELMELFVLGIGNYSEKDIKEAARAFTGWTFQENTFVDRKIWHDRGPKTILGKTADFDGDQVIDLLLEQPVASRYIARRLLREFAQPGAPEPVVEALAATLRESDWQLRPALKQLFRSQYFYSAPVVGTMIKSPVYLMASLMRTLKLDTDFSFAAVSICDKLGQHLFEPPNVKGWPGGRDWITTSLLLERYNAAQLLVSSPRELQVFSRRQQGRLNRIRQAIAQAQGMDPESMERASRHAGARLGRIDALDARKLVAGCKTTGELVDKLCQTLLAVPADAELRARLLAHVGGDVPVPSPMNATHVESLHGLLKLIVSTPEFQVQ